MTTGTARRLWALDGARLTLDRADMLDGAAPGPVELVVPSFLVEHDEGLLLLDSGLAPGAADDDPAHLHEALRRPAPMAADTDRRQALASLRRLIGLATAHDAAVWVTHDPEDWERFGAPGEITSVPAAESAGG